MQVNDFKNIQEAIKYEVLQDEKEYLKLLKVIGNNQKYDFSSQLSIYNKEPEARACATFDMWKKYFGRVVMRGQKGIPTLVGSDVNQRISYIFDISQTTSMDRNINEVSLWQFDHENHKEALKEIIRDSSFEASDSLNENIFSLSRIYGDEYINLALADLRIDIEDRLSFEKFMRDSISYAVANRFNTVYPMDMENLKNNFSRINTISLEQIGLVISRVSEDIIDNTIEKSKEMDRARLLTERAGGDYNRDIENINEDAFIYQVDYDGNVKLVTDKNFDKSFGNSIGTDARWEGNRTFQVHNDRFYFIATEFEESKLYSIDLKGDLKCELTGCVEDFYVTDKDIYYLEMGANHLAELKSQSKGEVLIENKIKDVHPIEEFTFDSNGEKLRGYILFPKDFDRDKKYPTILSVHGGPKTEFSDIFHHEHQMLASNGYIVIYTNPHGSSGRGVKFSDIRGRYGEIDYEDLMTFVDKAIEKYPQINPNKMAIYGGSYGGFMTNWTIGHTNRFKAAVSQRSISNWTSFYGVSDIGYYFAPDQTGANPWDNMEKMWDESPIKYANKANTPTLFIHADCDYRCPLEQGLQMFNKLKLNGVDTRMVVFHGENHELSRSGKPKARIKRLIEIKDWFDKHLKNEDTKEQI